MRLVFSIAMLAIMLASSSAFCQESDSQPTSGEPAFYPWEEIGKFKKYTMESYYITMRDSVHLAVDVYVPKSKDKTQKFPTIMHQTRYWRGIQLKWPYSWFKKHPIGPLAKPLKAMLQNGYAVVVVDSRGSGASEGQRDHPWTKDEIDDMYETVEHVIKQPWSNGVVGAAGASYSGTTSELLATTQHPNVKAVFNMFSLYDVYTDNAFPGGIHDFFFTSVWGVANEALDANTLPADAKKAKRFIKGVNPVKGKAAKAIFKKAQEDHKENRNVHDGAMTVNFRDDPPKGEFIKNMDIFSPHHYAKEEDESGVAVYSLSGWFDGNYQNAAVKRHLTLTNPKNKLMIGPWEHGATYNCSPYARNESKFDMMSELIRFFDHNLKGWDSGIEKEKPVHYFTMGEGKWKSSDVWPPENANMTPLYFADGKKLIWKNKLDQHDSLLGEMRFWGDSVNAMQSRGILKKLEGEGIVDGEMEEEMSNYRKADEQYRTAEAMMQSLTYGFRQERAKPSKPDTLVVNHEAGSGPFSRYRSLAGKLKTAEVYPDRKSRDSLNLVLETEALPANLEVTGHPIFECYLSSTTDDAQIFIYLEDVDEDGNVSYVTEGVFRAIHRKVTDKPFYNHPAPQHSYLREDAMPLRPGFPEKITFDMWPTSYQFKKGHKIRVSIAGADKDHFRNMTEDTPTYVFHHSFEKNSKLILPIVR